MLVPGSNEDGRGLAKIRVTLGETDLARAWFEGDAQDARDWLLEQGLVGADGRPTFALRG